MKLTERVLPVLALFRGAGLSSRIRGWDRGLRAVFPVAHQTKDPLQIMYRGYPYVAAPNHYVDWQVLTTGGYELADLAVFEAISTHLHRPVVVDIGANIGHHSFFFATLGWQVEAFEPNPELWPLVEAKIQAAKLDTIRLHRIGLGDKDEVLGFRVPDSANSGTGHFVVSDDGVTPAGSQLPIRRGDEYLKTFDINQVDLIKIDVQGFETQALNGLKETIARCRPIICVEIGDENRDSIPTLAALIKLLPDRYQFKIVRHRTTFIFRRSRLEALHAEDFASVDGNVFCLPAEKCTWLQSS